MNAQQEIFWVSNPGTLFQSGQLCPDRQATYEQRMNSLTRLVFVVFLVMYLQNYQYSTTVSKY